MNATALDTALDKFDERQRKGRRTWMRVTLSALLIGVSLLAVRPIRVAYCDYRAQEATLAGNVDEATRWTTESFMIAHPKVASLAVLLQIRYSPIFRPVPIKDCDRVLGQVDSALQYDLPSNLRYALYGVRGRCEAQYHNTAAALMDYDAVVREPGINEALADRAIGMRYLFFANTEVALGDRDLAKVLLGRARATDRRFVDELLHVIARRARHGFVPQSLDHAEALLSLR